MGARSENAVIRGDDAAGSIAGRSRLGNARLLTGALALGGLVGYLTAGWKTDLGAIAADPLMWLLAVAFCLSEIYTIDLPFKSHRHSYSMAEVPTILGLFFLSPAALVVSCLVGMGVAFLVVRRQRWLKLTFNMCLQFSMVVLQISIFELIAVSGDPTEASAMIAAYTAVSVSAIVSHAAVFAVISFVEGLWDRVLFWRGLWFGFATQLANASLGIIGVLLVDIDWRAIFILLTPVVVLYVAYHSLGRRVRVEEQLRVSERRFGALVRASSDVTALVAPDLTLEYVSDAAQEMLGADPAALLGKGVVELIHASADETTKFLGSLEEVKTSTEPVAFDITVFHRDGSDVQLEVSLTNLMADPAVGSVLMSLRNVTDRRRLEERLTQSEKMDAIGQLAGGIAHDFNNLLAVIQNYAGFVKSDLPPSSPSADDVDEIVNATAAASSLTKQLLSFARKEIVTPKVVSVNEVVSSVHRMLARTIEESVDLRTSLGPDLPHVKLDPGRLEQVLINLAVNAKDAMPHGGTLIIGTARTRVLPSLASEDLPAGEYVVVTVEDSGLGIPPAMLERVFEPFFTTKPKGHGTGLGLATVYGIVKQFKGHIEVESTVGTGSTFRVFLPAAAENEVPEAIPPAMHPREGTGTILLAEDSEPLRKLVQRVLANSSYTVLEAESGVEAFRLWQEHANDIDLLVTDVVMPKMSGRELSELTGLPTVFVSGYTDEILSQDDFAQGGFFLQKPFSATDLLSVVAEALAASPAAQV